MRDVPKTFGKFEIAFGRKAGYWSADCDFFEVTSNEHSFHKHVSIPFT
jgi:hypothetical protein